MRLLYRIAIGLAATATVAMGQVVTPVWVQHLNGEVNVDPANRLPILRKNVGGHEERDGSSTMVSLGKLLKYDATRYLLMVRENGIAEGSATPDDAALAAQYPDRSLIWIDAATGKPLGIAHVFGVHPVQVTGQGNQLDFFSQWGIDEGAEGTRALYYTHKNVLLRYAPKAGGGWESTPTCAWTEPTTGAKDCDGNELDGSTSGDGNQSFRWRNFRVTGSGTETQLLAGGGTWRQGMHPQIFTTSDGVKFHPISRVNDRDQGLKNNYSFGGVSTHVATYGLDPDRPNLQVIFSSHYPATGWELRPNRYVNDPGTPFRTIEDTYATAGVVSMFETGDAWRDNLSGSLAYPETPAGPNGKWGNLPAFAWEAAGQGGLPINHSQDGVEYYDGNWSCSLDANSSLDYVVNYAMPSWNVQFGSILKPGWIGVHRLDGSISANATFKIPVNEFDIKTPDEGDVGNTWGYDGDVTLYPDATAPANLKKSTLAWEGSAYGFGLFTIQNVASSVTTEPVDTVITENQTLNLSAVVSGSPNTYQWYKDGVALDGTATNPDDSLRYPATVVQGVKKASLAIPAAAVTDSGVYQLKVTNPLGNSSTRTVNVTVQADTVAPTIASTKVGRSPDTTYIKVVFSEAVTADTAGTVANYSLSGGIKVNGVRVVGSNSVILYTDTLTPGGSFTLTVNGVKDISSHGNVIAANSKTTVVGPVLTAGKILWEMYPAIGGGSVDDLLGDASFPGQPARWEYMSNWNTDDNGLSGVAETYGSRTSGWLTPTESGDYRFFIASDDGSSLFMNMTGPGTDPGSVTQVANEPGCCKAFLEPGDGVTQTSETITLTAGTSYYIYLLHKEGGGGDWSKVAWRKEGDATAAGSLGGIPASFISSYAPASTQAKFNLPVLSGGSITLTWTGAGSLYESTDLKNWTPVAGNPASGVSIQVSTPTKFYKLQN